MSALLLEALGLLVQKREARVAVVAGYRYTGTDDAMAEQFARNHIADLTDALARLDEARAALHAEQDNHE